MTFTAVKQISQQTPSRFCASYLGGYGMMFTVTAALALFTISLQVQAAEPSPPAVVQTRPAKPLTTTPAATTAPKYAAQDLERAFDFMDANHDGRVSREEAAAFPGVAKHFDEADINKDNFLSREEFANAMNAVKPQ